MSTTPRTPETQRRVQKKGSKPIACQPCHSRKVKCPGGHPCMNCRDAGRPSQCIYPSRDRQIKVSQQYVDDLLKENERLREGNASAVGPSNAPMSDSVRVTTASQETVENPLLEERPWFLPVASLDMPIHISEAADTAFATRFRQTLASVHTNHFPRMSYITDERILTLSDGECPWPTAARARFLVKVALNTVCRYYHIVRKSVVLDSLEAAIRNQGNGERLTICKLLALFALGEIYSTKTAANEASYPGLLYFARARKMVSVPAERPRMATIEIVVLLVLYSYALNRRHSAYSFATSAVRLGTILGMQSNIPHSQLSCRQTREHRIRLWWSVYILDLTCASKLGQPASIHHDDIHVDLPSSEGLVDDQGDFGDVDYILRNIELARLSSQVITSIYSRRRHQSPFSQRVQSSLKDLTKWVESLPLHLQLKDEAVALAPSNSILYLHITFNQCVILATRPILLHVLRCYKESWTNPSIDPMKSLPDSAHALAETCIQCSRHSYRLLTEAWIHGSFAVFDYFNAQYLFSAATVLAISSLLGSNNSRNDGECFDNAAELLGQLGQNGNLAAKELSQNFEAIKQSMAAVDDQGYRTASSTAISAQASTAAQGIVLPSGGSAMTAGMALAEPTLQELLAEPDLNLQVFDTPVFDGMQTPYWPDIWGDGWIAG